MHFLNERRESVRGENPEITFSELSKKLAAEWSALPEEEKLKYNEFAKKDKDRSLQYQQRKKERRMAKKQEKMMVEDY